MGSIPPLALRLGAATKRGLNRLAKGRRATPEALAAEAIADYVAHELAIVEKIERGLKQVREGRVVAHDEVMRQARVRSRRQPRPR